MKSGEMSEVNVPLAPFNVLNFKHDGRPIFRFDHGYSNHEDLAPDRISAKKTELDPQFTI